MAAQWHNQNGEFGNGGAKKKEKKKVAVTSGCCFQNSYFSMLSNVKMSQDGHLKAFLKILRELMRKGSGKTQ